MAIRLLLADDHVLFRETIVEYLERDTSMTFHVDQVGDLNAVKDSLGQQTYDAIILDWNMRGLGNMGILESMLASYPAQKFIVISGVTDADTIQKIHQTTIAGFFPKTMSGKDFVAAIKQIIGGDVIKRSEPAYDIDEIDDAILTEREKAVLKHILQGKPNKEIATDFEVSNATIKKHVGHILEKYECSSRAELMAKWIK